MHQLTIMLDEMLGCSTRGLCHFLRMDLSGISIALVVALVIAWPVAISVAFVAAAASPSPLRRPCQQAVKFMCVLSALVALAWYEVARRARSSRHESRMAVCARFASLDSSTTPAAHEVLCASIALYCSDHHELASHDHWGWDRLIDVRLACDATDVFLPLQYHRDHHTSEDRAPVVSSCELCALVTSWRRKQPSRPFVVLDLLPFPVDTSENHGTLTLGYDFSCVAEASPAQFRACRLENHFRAHCPGVSMVDVLALLDSPKLIAWFTYQYALRTCEPCLYNRPLACMCC